MANLNRLILTGRLTRDPELRYTANEIPVTHFSLAVNRNGKKNKDAESVDFINCIAWRGLAKICGQYLKKGRLVALEGKLQIRKYESKGQKRSATEVIVDNLQMLDKKFYDVASSTQEKPADALPPLKPEKKNKKK